LSRLGNLSREHGARGRHVDEQRAGLGAFDDAAFAQIARVDVGRKSEHRDHDVAGAAAAPTESCHVAPASTSAAAFSLVRL